MSSLTNVRSQDESSNREISALLPSHELVPLAAIVRTDELHRRPARAPDYQTENRALVTLVRALADAPRTILQTLADTILEMFKADSAGMSLLAADGKSFYWPAIAGGWERHVTGGTPRDFGPCGDVLDRNAPMLFTHWERRYPYLLAVTPAAVEGLLVPFHVEGRAVGTIWAITHQEGREFDAEDLRQLESLGRFASAAFQAIASLEAVHQRVEAVRLSEALMVSSVGQHELIKSSELLNAQLRTEIAARAATQNALSESEMRFRALVTASSDVVYRMSPDWGEMRELRGRSFLLDTEESNQIWFKQYIPVIHQAHVLQAINEAIRTKSMFELEHQVLRVDGTYGWTFSRAVPLLSDDGEIIEWFGTATDVTERKQSQENIRVYAERARFVMDSMPQKIFTAKPDGKLDYFNRQYTDFTGLAFEQIRDSGWIEFIHPDDRPDNVRLWQQSVDTGVPFRFEQRLRGAEGTYRWHLSQAVPMRDAQGEITMWIGSSTDIQEVRNQEERLRRTEKMAAAGRLASSIAHEINNPLSSVMNALYLIETQEKELDESVRQLVTTASSELARVSRIVKQSLSYHRVGTIPREFDLSSIVNESLQIFGLLLREAGVELKTRIEKGRPLLGFPDELRQVIDNLLRNAMEAMPQGGRLHVSVRESLDWTGFHNLRKGARLTIADSGCGIPKEYRSRILDPFFTTKAEKGNGLGLWISQGIVSKHEGVLSLRSSDTKIRSGTVISLFLPSISNAAGSNAVEQSPPSERPSRAVWASISINETAP
jgi:PAS domain S-box-containing protein